MNVDTRANVERPADQRPVAALPIVPDLESTGEPWHGPAGAQAGYWRKRALAAEAHVAELQRQLTRYRGRS